MAPWGPSWKVMTPVVLAAAAVGTVSIGGVLPAPALTLSGAMDAHQAASTWCLMVTGLAGAYGHLGGHRELRPLLHRQAAPRRGRPALLSIRVAGLAG